MNWLPTNSREARAVRERQRHVEMIRELERSRRIDLAPVLVFVRGVFVDTSVVSVEEFEEVAARFRYDAVGAQRWVDQCVRVRRAWQWHREEARRRVIACDQVIARERRKRQQHERLRRSSTESVMRMEGR